MANPIGRPSGYNIGIATEICETIASTSDGLIKLCRDNKHWPVRSVIFKWLLKNSDFADMYFKAKVWQVSSLVDEILYISDDVSHDTTTNKNGDLVANNEYINRSRLRVESRKWLAAKLCPRLYGDKIQYDAQINVKQEDALKELE
ncbi:MAG TPA: hypothetical protein VNX01_15220 [Bacteroidia bacterium]|nr:hypothetical protein [Bacteroidia bacterium]